MMAGAALVRAMMRFRFVRRLLGLSLLLPLLASADAPTHHTIVGRVVGVSDGDTITLLDATFTQRKIRLAGIDAPEKAQPFGSRAKLALSSLAFGRDARAECGKPDRYGREICKVIVAGRDINIAMIEAGLAWHYTAYAKTQAPRDAIAYSMAQGRARGQRAGLWADTVPMAPWEWRRSRRQR